MSTAAVDARLSLVPADPGPEIVTVSEVMLDAIADADRYAVRGLPILLVGETGTGKDLLARRIHARSNRRGALIAVNCAELRPEQAANLLFGHKRGAFTGATESTEGFVRRSSRGTLFLDEVTSLPFETQPTLLRVLETGEVTPFGDDRVLRVDLRVVAAAQPSIRQMLLSGEARMDLYERLAVSTVVLPSLRERPDDIWLLAASFARQHGARLLHATATALLDYHWPGNVRELKSVIQRAVAHAAEGCIGGVEIARAMQPRLALPDDTEGNERRERHRLRELCIETAGDWRRLVELTRVSRSTLYRQLRDHGLSLRQFRHS
jgi:DNA-binding NtrC family response regulator